MVSTTTKVDTLAGTKPSSRRRHDADLKARVVAACAEPGASVAQVAMANGLNANLVHKWRRGGDRSPTRPAAAFIELPMPHVTGPAAPPDIRIELRRGPTTVSINWPSECAAECAVWLRELLK